MIVYSNTAMQFRQDVDENQITAQIAQSFLDHLGYLPGEAERRSWQNSMQFMERVVRRSQIPDDCGVLIEYNIPATSLRIDFMLTGQDIHSQDSFVIVELKQWDRAEATTRPDVVSTFVGGRYRDVLHPSYQAFSYLQYLSNMNEAVQTHGIVGRACAYLHNYAKKQTEPLLHPQYLDITRSAPIFFREDQGDMQKFLYQSLAKGKGIHTMHFIEHGRLRPSQKLMDHVAGLLKGNDEFILLDEQKVVFETIIERAQTAEHKTVIVVKGGPGTGKSVLSMHVLGRLLQAGKNIRFVAPNAAFRQVMIEHLAKSRVRNRAKINALFSGSSKFWETPLNAMDILVVDEAHRLKKRGAFMYRGENQVEDVVRAAHVCILFIDDHQQIRPDDVGTTTEIRRLAATYRAELVELELEAQFRCAGAAGFLNWIDDVLQVRHTGNYDGWDRDAFEFELMDSPHDLYQRIQERQSQGYKARMLAGYAWEWTRVEENPLGEVADVVIPEHDFAMPWNQRQNSSLWAILPEGVGQIGCVHTSQGLEFDYIGVIVGKDLCYDPASGEVCSDASQYKDRAGIKGIAGNRPELTRLIKNIYRILFSRGMKGCYVYVCEEGMRERMKNRMPFRKTATS